MVTGPLGTAECLATVATRPPPGGRLSTREEQMTHTEMLEAHPSTQEGVDVSALADCIAACFECSQVCTACADACLAEPMVAELTHCITTDLDCADVCAATGRVLTRRTETDAALVRSLLEACAAACATCAEECEQHAEMHEHCRICAEVCRRCEEACRALLATL